MVQEIQMVMLSVYKFISVFYKKMNITKTDDNDLLYEINKIKSPTSPDEKFTEMRREMIYIKHEIKNINRDLCVVVHRLSVLQTRLNLVDDTI